MICRNVTKGCIWEGSLGDLDKHINVCSFTLIACPNKCSYIARKDVEEHLKDCPNREHPCEHCGERGRYADITGHHQVFCDQKVIPCGNDGCDELVKRKDITKHVTDTCEHAVISCKYKRIGCHVKMKRRDMREHEDKEDKFHLQKALDAANKAKVAVDSTILLEKDEKFVFKILDYIGKPNVVFRSPYFYTSACGYHMCVNVYGYKDKSISICVLEGKFDETLNWPFIGTISVEALNQEDNCNHYVRHFSIKFEDNLRPGQHYRCQGFLNEVTGYSSRSTDKYFKNNTLYFRVSVSHERSWLQCTPERKYTPISSTYSFEGESDEDF